MNKVLYSYVKISLISFGILSALCSFMVMYSDENAMQTRLALTAVRYDVQEINRLQAAIPQLWTQSVSAGTTLQDIQTLMPQITALKDQLGISAAESSISGLQDQLNQAAVPIWVKSKDLHTGDPATNYYLSAKINRILSSINNDEIIKNYRKEIDNTRASIAKRIYDSGWAKEIQDAGKIIDRLIIAEAKTADQALAQVASAQAALITSQSTAMLDKVFLPIQQEVTKKQLALDALITELPQESMKQLQRYKYDLKKIGFVLGLIGKPHSIASINEDDIEALEANEMAGYTPAADAQPPTTDGQFVIHQLTDSLYNISEMATEVIKKNDRTRNMLKDMENLSAQFKKLKVQNNITSAENQIKTAQSQLNVAAATIFDKSIDPSDHINVYRKIYSTVKEIFSDAAIQNNVNSLLNIYHAIAKRVDSQPTDANSWLKQLQSAGAIISKNAGKEVNAAAQIIAQIQSAQGQLIATRSGNKDVDEKLVPLEKKLTKLQFDLQNKLSGDIADQIRQYKYNILRLQFVLQIIQNPRMVESMTGESLGAYEITPSFASNEYW